jgi:hypothetical protein
MRSVKAPATGWQVKKHIAWAPNAPKPSVSITLTPPTIIDSEHITITIDGNLVRRVFRAQIVGPLKLRCELKSSHAIVIRSFDSDDEDCPSIVTELVTGWRLPSRVGNLELFHELPAGLDSAVRRVKARDGSMAVFEIL